MDTYNTSTQTINTLLKTLSQGTTIHKTLTTQKIPTHIITFTTTTTQIIQKNQTHTITKTFTIKHENTIPNMFRTLITHLQKQYPKKLKILINYLKQHIKLNNKHHKPITLQILSNIYKNNKKQ